MGQYYRLINHDKKEYIEPWTLGTGAKLWEWCANKGCRLLPFLLRQSTEGGGGDIRQEYESAGHWAGDRIVLVGDYDISCDYERAANEYKDITLQVAQEFNDFIECPELKVNETYETQ